MRRAFLAFCLLPLSLPAHAATVTYLYVSTPVTCTVGPCENAYEDDPWEGDNFSAILTIDEAVSGIDLVDADVSFDSYETGPIPGFDFQISVPGIGMSDWTSFTVATLLQLTTDAARNIVDGRVDVLDGPPDYYFANGIAAVSAYSANAEDGPDLVDTATGFWATARVEPGTDIPTIPLPAGLPLLLVGLGALGLARRGR